MIYWTWTWKTLVEDRTKSILFYTKNRKKKIGTLDIQYGDVKIKQYSKVTYPGRELDESLSGESMALKVINKINSRLKFLYRKNRYLKPCLKRLLCNAWIQSHFDYACSAWYPNLNKKLTSKLLPVSERFNQYLCSDTFKFFKETCSQHFHDIYRQSRQNQANTRSSVLKLKHPLRNTCSGKKNCRIWHE